MNRTAADSTPQRVDRVVTALAGIGSPVESINETQQFIGGVLTEQSAVTRELLA